MRILLTIIFLFFSAFLSGQQLKTAADGFTVFYYDNGKKSSEGTMQGGRPTGYWKTYYPNGKLKSEGNRKDFELDSTWKFYNEEGILAVEFNYKTGKKNGPKKTYDTKENYLISEENFKDDVKHGISKYYYPDGKLKNTIPFIAGKEEGQGYEYSPDGTIITLTDYKAGFIRKQEKINRRDKGGLKQGVWKDFYASGKLKYEGKYSDDKKNGFFKEYSENGNLLKTTKFINDVEQKDVPELAKIEIKTEYYEGGRVKATGGFKNGVPEGIHRQYQPSGEVAGAKVYKEGIVTAEGVLDSRGLEQGEWKEYYTNGNLKSKGEYKDGKRVGDWVFYHQEGKIEQKGKYDKKGKPTGVWKWYYESGNLLREENYVNGSLEGLMTEYSDSGKVITKGEYQDNQKEGPWTYEMGGYREEGSYKADKQDGEWKNFYADGKLLFEGKFIDGNPDGKHVWYYANGKKREEGKFIVGRKDGEWNYYSEDGSVFLTITYKDDEEIKFDGVKVPEGEGKTEEGTK